MSDRAAGNSMNAAKGLLNQAQGYAGPGSPIMSGFQSSLGTAQGNQADLLNSATGNIGALQDISKAYEPFAQTGGFDPKQSQQFIQQATEGIGSTYGALEDQVRRSQTATGGLGTSGGLSQMARQLSQAQSKGTLDAQVALDQQKTANKLAGLGGEVTATGIAGNQLNQLYNTTTGQVTQLGNQILSTLGIDFSTQAEAASILDQISKNPSLFQTIGEFIKSAGGGVGAAAGGIGG